MHYNESIFQVGIIFSQRKGEIKNIMEMLSFYCVKALFSVFKM